MCDAEPTARQARAMERYRELWVKWRFCMDDELRQSYETEMDFWQERVCCGRPCPRWRAFAESLDGFVTHWEQWAQEGFQKIQPLLEAIDEKKGDVNFLLTKSN